MNWEFVLIALKNIQRHWRKSLITGACIALGFSGILLLGGYMIRMENYLTTQGIYLNHVGHLSLYKKQGLERHLVEPERYSFAKVEQQMIAKVLEANPHVEKVAFFFHGQGLITNGCKTFPFIAWASEPQVENYLRNYPEVIERIPLLTKLHEGKGFWQAPILENKLVVTRRLADLLDKKVLYGDKNEDLSSQDKIIEDCKDTNSKKLIQNHSGIQLMGQMLGGGMGLADSNITGHFTTGFAMSEDNSLLMPLAFAQNFYGTDNVTSIGIFLKDRKDTKSLLKEFKKKFDLDIYPYDDYRVNPFYVGAMRFVYIMNLFFFLIVCGVIIISLFNSLQIAMLERKSEIGTLLSVGFRKMHVRKLFEFEVLMLAVMSLVVGIIISFSVATLINNLNIQFDIVGNAEKIKLMLALDWRYIILMSLIFLVLVYSATTFICRKHLQTTMLRLMERID